MKPLYLKNGLFFDIVEFIEFQLDEKKIVKIIKNKDFKISNGGFNKCTVNFANDETDFYIVSGVAEIIENFDWYFNNLK